MCKVETCKIVARIQSTTLHYVHVCYSMSGENFQVWTSQGFSSSKCQNDHVHVYCCIGWQCGHHYYLSVVWYLVYKIHATDILVMTLKIFASEINILPLFLRYITMSKQQYWSLQVHTVLFCSGTLVYYVRALWTVHCSRFSYIVQSPHL